MRYAGKDTPNNRLMKPNATILTPIMTVSRISSIPASRFYTHWINADPSRLEAVAALAELSLSSLDFAPLLQNETDAGIPLQIGRAHV